MITIPLSTVRDFCQRRGAVFGCLEGAPRLTTDGEMMACSADFLSRLTTYTAEAINGWSLYLGTGDICPAAMGWATRLLELHGPPGFRGACRLAIGRSAVSLSVWDTYMDAWAWDGSVDWGVSCDIRWMAGEPPPTPAERLKAVLLFEMGR